MPTFHFTPNLWRFRDVAHPYPDLWVMKDSIATTAEIGCEMVHAQEAHNGPTDLYRAD